MWDWKQLFGSTSTRKASALETAFLAQSKAIADVMKRQQDLIAKQQETLDRIVTAKYDRPIATPATPVPSDPMPEWALNDQGDVTPEAIAAITAESDADFLKAAGVQ